MIAIRRIHIPAPPDVAQPEHQEQISIHAAAPGVAKIFIGVLGSQLALGAECPLRSEVVGAIHYALEQQLPA